jgi:hypothetical protein
MLMAARRGLIAAVLIQEEVDAGHTSPRRGLKDLARCPLLPAVGSARTWPAYGHVRHHGDALRTMNTPARSPPPLAAQGNAQLVRYFGLRHAGLRDLIRSAAVLPLPIGARSRSEASPP